MQDAFSGWGFLGPQEAAAVLRAAAPDGEHVLQMNAKEGVLGGTAELQLRHSVGGPDNGLSAQELNGHVRHIINIIHYYKSNSGEGRVFGAVSAAEWSPVHHSGFSTTPVTNEEKARLRAVYPALTVH